MIGGTPRLVISPDLIERMLDSAWSAYPAEAVGLLGGIADEVRSVWPLRNLAANLTFLADPYQQYIAMTEIRAAGEGALIGQFSLTSGGTCSIVRSGRSVRLRGCLDGCCDRLRIHRS